MPAIEGHHDFAILEERLAELIREAKASDPFAPVTVVVPTSRLRRHVQIVLAERLGAAAGVHILHHQALAREIASASGVPYPKIASPRVLRAILGEVVNGSRSSLAGYVERRPGCLPALFTTMNELREAEVDPAQALAVAGLSQDAPEILRFYAEYAARCDELQRSGIADHAGAIRRAVGLIRENATRHSEKPQSEAGVIAASGAAPRAGSPSSRMSDRRLVIHYGAHDLIGVNLSLMRALESAGARVVFLVPWHPSSPAFERTRRFTVSLQGGETAPISIGAAKMRDGARLLGTRLPSMYDESAPPLTALPQGAVEMAHAQGEAAELREVALRILALHRDRGVPLSRIGVIARSLEPYSALLSSVFGAHSISFSTNATLGAVREAGVQAARNLALCVLQDFERRPLMGLLRSGLWIGGSGGADAHTWERLGREWRVFRGYKVWTEDLPGWLDRWQAIAGEDADEETKARAAALTEARRRHAASLAREVAAMSRAAAPLRGAKGWAAWADEMERLCARSLRGFDGGGRDATAAGRGPASVLGLLSEMRDLDRARVPFSQAAALGWFTAALSETETPVGSEIGIQVLDAMQARGLSFDTVFLIGFNADLIPRRPKEDPFLPDEVRRLLRSALGSPIEIKSDGLLEEHLLLAQIVGAAERTLIVTWQRADASGRARVPSLALRELARIAAGGAHVQETMEAAMRIPAHPLDAARDAAGRLGLLSPGEARMASVLQTGSPGGVIEFRDQLPPAGDWADGWEALSAGLSALSTVEGFTQADLSHDGFVGDAVPAPGVWSASRLETLGCCPQLYLFRHALGAEEMEDPGEEHSIEAREIGSRVHRILHDVYRTLIDSGDLSSPTADPSRAARKAGDLVEEVWARHTLDLAERIHPRHPLLWEMISTQWRNALHTFVLYDVAALVREGSRIIGLEHPAEAKIPMGQSDVALGVRGRFDRVLRGAGRTLIVSDYKSHGALDRHVEMKDALKGARLQLALYTLIASECASSWGVEAPEIRAEALGVGPDYQAEEVEKTRLNLDPEKLAAGREGFLETLGVLARLAESGIFPLNERSIRCASCSYSRACRRSHPPTLARLAGAAGAKDYYLVRRKNTKDPTLAAVRRRTDDEEEEVEEA